jgi:type I restriction enzyme M protein
MNDFEQDDQNPQQEGPAPEESTESDGLVDILSGAVISATPKNALRQQVLSQLINTYGFDRKDLAVDYKPAGEGRRPKIDVVIFSPGAEHTDENIERLIVCVPQKKREKLRSLAEVDVDLQKLKEAMQQLPKCSFGMWTNGFEEFFLKATESKFEIRFLPLGAWPAPGEGTTAVFKEGGATQVAADPENLEAVLVRSFQYLNKNLGLDHKAAFQQIAVLLIAKLHDETQPVAERQFWVKGDEPFDVAGQKEIQKRIAKCLAEAKTWKPELFVPGWDLHISDPAHLARLVMELARFSLSETLPRSRTLAYRAIVRSTMDGREGRYPTPINVAEMAVRMVKPKPTDRILDCSSGTGTFLAFAAANYFEERIKSRGKTQEEASPEELRKALEETSAWASDHLFGCEIDPYLAVATRLNLLFTAGHQGQVFRIDARTFPDGELDGIAAAKPAIQEGSMDVVLTNPWFSTSASGLVTDESILKRYDLGKDWIKLDDGTFSNTGTIASSGVPPEVLFLERAWKWAKPGAGQIAILLPDGVLGNPSDEYVRWWILRHCEVLASVDLPIEPFKVTVKEYKLTPALPSLLVLRRRSPEELKQPTYEDYWVFMAVVDRAGVDPRGKILFQRKPDGDELIVTEEVVERVRTAEKVEVRRVKRKMRKQDDETPTVAERFNEFVNGGRKGA